MRYDNALLILWSSAFLILTGCKYNNPYPVIDQANKTGCCIGN
jgi:hypothetical protein